MQRTYTALSIGLLLWVLAAGGVAAQRLDGTVLSGTGQPLAGATVQLFDEGAGTHRYGTATSHDGRFVLAHVQAGRYQLVVSYVGFAEHRERMVLEAGETITRRIRLSAREVPQQEVVVTALRAREQLTPITFSNLTAHELEELPAMKDLPVLLSTQPSITYYSENGNGMGYSYLRMRGFDQKRVAVAINGIPQNDPESHNVFWINFFDLQGAIEDIQIQRGAGASFYGPTAIGGAINIVAKPYKPYSYVTAEVGYGAFDTYRYTLEANTGLLNNRYVAYGRFSRLLSGGYRDWSWTEFWRFFAGVVRYGDRSSLTIQAYGGPQKDGLAYVGIPKAANEGRVDDGFGGTIDRRHNYSAAPEEVENFHQPHVELLHEWRVAPNIDVHQALFWINGAGYFDIGGTFLSANFLRLPDSVLLENPGTCDGFAVAEGSERFFPLYCTVPGVSSLTFRYNLDQWQAGWMPRLTVRHGLGETTLGAEARLHRSLRWGRIQEAEGLPPSLVGPDDDLHVYEYHGEKAVASVYGSHLARPLERLAVQADLQLSYRHYRIYDVAFSSVDFRVPYVFVNPRLGVTINPERPLHAYASVGYAQREPRMVSLYDGEGGGYAAMPQFERNPDGTLNEDDPLVEPEHLLDIEVGAALTKRRYRLAANVFFMDFRDEIVPSGGLDQFGVPRTGNADHTRHIGLEVEGTIRLAPGLDVHANTTLSRNRFVDFTEFVTLPNGAVAGAERDGNPIAGFPEQVVNAGAVYRTGGLTASVNAKVAGTQYVDNAGGRNLDGTPNDELEVNPYLLVNASVQYDFPRHSTLRGLRLALDVNNVLDDEVLLFGNAGFGAPQFFPAATRHAFFSVRYTVR